MEGDWSSIAIGFILGLMGGWFVAALVILEALKPPKPEMRYFILLGTKVRAFGKTSDGNTAKEFATWLSEVPKWRYWYCIYTGR